MEKKLGKRMKGTKNWEKGRKGRKKYHQSRFLEALLVWQADGELKKQNISIIISEFCNSLTPLIFKSVFYMILPKHNLGVLSADFQGNLS